MSTDWIAEAQAATQGICPEPKSHNMHTDGKHAFENCPHCGGDKPLATPKLNDQVKFRAMRDPLGDDETVIVITGTVVRAWGKPAADPYVTIKTGDHRIFVRCTSAVAVIPPGATA